MEQPRNDIGQFVSLKDYITSIMDEREKSHTREHVLIDKALTATEGLRQEAIDQARVVVNDRLGHLNELRQEVTKDRSLYVTRDMFDLQIKPLREFRNKALGFGTVLALISAITGSVVTAVILGVFK